MEYPNTNFEDVIIGDVFRLYIDSTLLFEKTGETEAKHIVESFGIILGKKDNVIIVANS